MRTINDVVEEARADLAKAEQREVRARDALNSALADKERLENFLGTLASYVDVPAAKASVAMKAPRASAGRPTRYGDLAIERITDRRQPMRIADIAAALEREGIELKGGEKRNAYLASYLSKDPRLKYVERRGWWVIELGACDAEPNDTAHSAIYQHPENEAEAHAEASDDEAPHGDADGASDHNPPQFSLTAHAAA